MTVRLTIEKEEVDHPIDGRMSQDREEGESLASLHPGRI
jgi:hypothetical protein